MKKQSLGKITMEEMLKTGVHFGHSKSKWQPKTEPYIFGIKKNIHIINLALTEKALEDAQKFISKIVAQGKQILFIGTKKHLVNIIKEYADKVGMPYVNNRWLGGTFTNFEIIREQIQKLTDLEKKIKHGELKHYTKKEQNEFQKNADRLNRNLEGLKVMDKLPGAIFVVGADKDNLAIKEAHEKGIPVIAFLDTNIDPKHIDYPIPANDDSLNAVKLILKGIIYAIKKGQQKQ